MNDLMQDIEMASKYFEEQVSEEKFQLMMPWQWRTGPSRIRFRNCLFTCEPLQERSGAKMSSLEENSGQD